MAIRLSMPIWRARLAVVESCMVQVWAGCDRQQLLKAIKRAWTLCGKALGPAVFNTVKQVLHHYDADSDAWNRLAAIATDMEAEGTLASWESA